MTGSTHTNGAWRAPHCFGVWRNCSPAPFRIIVLSVAPVAVCRITLETDSNLALFLSLSTTHRPATDLGFLLMKHPDRVHEVDLAFGKAIVFFPEANEARCEAALALDIDPVGLVRRSGEAIVDQYVNDRPYAASSFLSVAINRMFRTAMSGVSRERPELA